MMHKEDFKRKRENDFLEKMKHLYNSIDSKMPRYNELLYNTKIISKIYLLLKGKDWKTINKIVGNVKKLLNNMNVDDRINILKRELIEIRNDAILKWAGKYSSECDGFFDSEDIIKIYGDFKRYKEIKKELKTLKQ